MHSRSQDTLGIGLTTQALRLVISTTGLFLNWFFGRQVSEQAQTSVFHTCIGTSGFVLLRLACFWNSPTFRIVIKGVVVLPSCCMIIHSFDKVLSNSNCSKRFEHNWKWNSCEVSCSYQFSLEMYVMRIKLWGEEYIMIYYGRGFLAVGQVCGCGLGES